MILFRERTRRASGLLAAIAAVIAVALHVSWAPAATVIGPTPSTTHASISFTTTTDNLNNGDAVHFTVSTNGSTATGAVTLNKVEAKICAHGFTTYGTTTFGYANSAGVRCVNEAGITSGGLTGAQYRLGPLAFSSVTSSGDQFLLVGTGTVTWTNASGFPGSLTCDDTHQCDLVVNVGMTNDAITDTFFIQPLTFAASGTTTTTTTSTTSPTTTTQPGTTTTTQPGTTTTTQPGTTTTTTAPTTTTKPTTTTSSSTTTSSTTTMAPTTTTTAPTTSSSTTTTTPGNTTTTAPPNEDGTVTPGTVPPGGTITVSSTGWKPSSSVTVTLHSDPVTLGALDVSAKGAVGGSFTVPAGTPTGSHDVVLTGTDPQDQARTVTIPVTVQASTTVTTLVTGVGGTSTGTTGSTGSKGNLAFTGSTTRNLVSIALLLLAVGFFALGQSNRRRAHRGR